MPVSAGATADFVVVRGDGRSASDLLTAGRYDWVGDFAKEFALSKKFLVSSTSEEVVIEPVLIEGRPTEEEVLAVLASRGLQRPRHEDALLFGERYPVEHMKAPICFVHEPWVNRGNGNHVSFLMLWRSFVRNWRGVGCTTLAIHYESGLRFAGCRPRFP